MGLVAPTLKGVHVTYVFRSVSQFESYWPAVLVKYSTVQHIFVPRSPPCTVTVPRLVALTEIFGQDR